MRFQYITTAATLALLSPTVTAATTLFEEANYRPQDIIERDVAIIGGGSSGIYSAISLKDAGKSVIVVEKKYRLGGHTETYIDPKTGTPIDMGVVVFHNTTLVQDYFKRLGVPFVVSTSSFGGGETKNIDLKTGKTVAVNGTSPQALGAAFANYGAVLQKYPALSEGSFLPDPVPDELVLPLYDFLKKYKAQDALPTMYQFNAGMGDVFKIPAVENMKTWGFGLVSALQNGFLTTARHNNSELYTNAQAELQKSNSVLLRTEVLYTHRSDNGVALVVGAPTGLKLIKAKKLLITIPPKLDIVRPLDLSSDESTLFGKFQDTGYTTSIVNNTGLPDNLSINNADPKTPYSIPKLPGVYSIGATAAPGLKTVYLGTNKSPKTYPISDKDAQKIIIDSIKAVQASDPKNYQKTDPYFVAYSSHAPFYLQASAEDIKAGFYKKLYALQGQRSTYWTGATWRAHDSSEIWSYTKKYVLPGVLKGL